MENFGCVVWTDALLFRSPPTTAQRQTRAFVLLHEMAHMWFGDIVTDALVGRPVVERVVRGLGRRSGRPTASADFPAPWSAFACAQGGRLLRGPCADHAPDQPAGR
jgi:aminopeptidase N